MKIEKLEAIRGLAALYVVLHHSVPHVIRWQGINIGHAFRFGQEAVILFFILSGFVINHSFKRTSDSTFGAYFVKRFSRIYIPLVFIYALGYVAKCFDAHQFADPEIKYLALNVLMLQDVASLKPNVIVSPYMGNTPLWSLSYEWWFYMMYFPIQKFLRSGKDQSLLVFLVSIISAVVYIWSPTFIVRLLMYFGIWWSGVFISNLMLEHRAVTISSLLIPIGALALISLTLGINALIFLNHGQSGSIGLHPYLEARHYAFALVAILVALMWKSLRWIFFKHLIGPFALVAPISYVIYISHYYIIVNASYLSFIGNSILEWVLYFVVLIAFSCGLELKVYPFLSAYLRGITICSSRRRK